MAPGRNDRATQWTPSAFAEAFGVHWRTLWSIAAAICNDRAAAEDIVQDAAMIGMDKLDDFDPNTNFVAWMGAIVRFTALNHVRRAGRGGSAIDVTEHDQPSRAERVDGSTSLSPGKLAAALDVLDPIARACLVLRTTAELSYREIAVALDIPEGTAMSHVHRSRTTLRHLLAAARDDARDAASEGRVPR